MNSNRKLLIPSPLLLSVYDVVVIGIRFYCMNSQGRESVRGWTRSWNTKMIVKRTGAGPAGYVASIKAAQLGLKVRKP